jgi:AcrR family transcriptional regulator
MAHPDDPKPDPRSGPSLSDDERARVRAALFELTAEVGYQRVALAEVLSRAGVDAASFEGDYENLDACFAELCQGFFQQAAEETIAAYAAEENWRDGMRAQVWASYRFLDEDHRRARICVVEMNFGGELLEATRDLFMGAYAELVHLGRHEGNRREDIPRATAEAITGACWEQIAGPIKGGDFDRLIDVVPQVLYLIYLPYLGAEAAEEELRQGRAEVARVREDG